MMMMMMMMIYVCVYLGNESVKSRIINLFQKKRKKCSCLLG